MSLLLLNIPIIQLKIEVGRPHDLNPASYEDTKKIVREESVKAGISKYGDLSLPLYVMDHHTKISLVCSMFCFFGNDNRSRSSLRSSTVY